MPSIVLQFTVCRSSLVIALQEKNCDHAGTNSGQKPLVTILGTVTSSESIVLCDSHAKAFPQISGCVFWIFRSFRDS